MFLNISLIHKLVRNPSFAMNHMVILSKIQDLKVIQNAKLRELVAKGQKCREPSRVNWKATETMFLESIDLYAKNWSKREQVELKYLSEWKDHLKELVADRISNLKAHFKSLK